MAPPPTGGGGGAGRFPPGGIGLGPFPIGGGGGSTDPGGGPLGGFPIGGPAGGPCGGGGGGGGAWDGGGKGLGGTPGAVVPLAAGVGWPLFASGGLGLKYNCNVNIFESGSQCEKNFGVDLSISVLGTLKEMISYGSAANRRYWYLLSKDWTLCSKDDINRCLGFVLSSISGYSIWKRRDLCFVSGSNCFVTR